MSGMTDFKNRFVAFWLRFGLELSAILFFLLIPPLAWFMGYNVGNAILWATGLVLLAYTIETQGMRFEMVRQNEIAIQPLLLSSIEPHPAAGQHQLQDGRAFVLRNIGRGPALFIQVNDIEVGIDTKTRRTWVIKFDKLDCIQGGERVPLDLYTYAESGGSTTRGMDAIDELDPRSASKNYNVTISYKDINGQRYESLVLMGRDGVELLDHGKARQRR